MAHVGLGGSTAVAMKQIFAVTRLRRLYAMLIGIIMCALLADGLHDGLIPYEVPGGYAASMLEVSTTTLATVPRTQNSMHVSIFEGL